MWRDETERSSNNHIMNQSAKHALRLEPASFMRPVTQGGSKGRKPSMKGVSADALLRVVIAVLTLIRTIMKL
jgi:hypothetical protein